MPIRVRPGAGMWPMSCPRNSIVPDVWGMSPEMTLNSVVFPAPLGPRMARLSPCATSRSTSRTASRPPNRRPIPRRRRIGPAGSVVTPSTSSLPDDLHRGGLAEPRQAALLAARGVAARSRRRRAERAAERLVDAGDLVDRLDGQLAALHEQLLVVDRDDRLAVGVELDLAVRSRKHDLRQRRLELALVGDVALDGLEALDEAPRV